MRGSRPFTDFEMKLIELNIHDLRDKALFVLGCKTGFRISELLSLKVKDVFQYDEIVDRITVKRSSMKKKTAGRTVLLNEQAKKVLLPWVLQLAPNDFLFRAHKDAPNQVEGAPISRIQAWRLLNVKFKELNLTGKLGTHCMRKSYATKMYDLLDGDLVKTQKAMGHVSINSTVSYLSFREEDIDEAILKL